MQGPPDERCHQQQQQQQQQHDGNPLHAVTLHFQRAVADAQHHLGRLPLVTMAQRSIQQHLDPVAHRVSRQLCQWWDSSPLNGHSRSRGSTGAWAPLTAVRREGVPAGDSMLAGLLAE